MFFRLFLSHGWSPLLTVSSLLLSISSLLGDPNCGDPLNLDASDFYEQNRIEFNKVAREWTRKYAMKEPRSVAQPQTTQLAAFEHLQQQPGQTDIWETVDEDEAYSIAVAKSKTSEPVSRKPQKPSHYKWSHELSS